MFNRWLYRGGRPNRLARALNAAWAAIASTGISRNYMETLEVIGRRSGRVIALPVVIAVVDGERYLASMLGENVGWVQNVRAAHGRAVLRSGGIENIRLEMVPPERRAPILKAYLERAPGARPHIPVDKDAPLASFEAIADEFPVFRIASLDVVTHTDTRTPWRFVVLTFSLSVPLWILGAFTDARLVGGLPVSASMAFCPAIAAALLVHRRGTLAAVAAFFARSFDVRRVRPALWYVPLVLLLPAIMALSFVIAPWVGRTVATPDVSMSVVVGSFAAFFVAALGEELGWSGYATEPLQARLGFVRAALVLGAIWAVWHLIPLLQMGRASQWIAWWSVQTIALRVVIVYFYDRAGGSVFAVALLHGISNVCTLTFAAVYDPAVTGVILAIVAAGLTIERSRTRPRVQSADRQIRG
jgi:membrane protease YdiL (CAAX protease family)